MNTQYIAARGTGPPFLFVSDEMSYAEFLNMRKVVDHTHAILGSVTFIQMSQPVAGKPVTPETVPDVALPYCFTVLYPAFNAGFRFNAVVAPATGACLLVPGKRATEAAVHSTGRNQRRSDHLGLCWFSRYHVRIPAERCIVILF